MQSGILGIVFCGMLFVLYGVVGHKGCTGHCAGCTGACGRDEELHHHD